LAITRLLHEHHVSGAILDADFDSSASALKGPCRTLTWTEWQNEVVAHLQGDFEELLQHISLEDVDWASWLQFYRQGRSPRSAVDRAMERDL
jgi:hypothetical protein